MVGCCARTVLTSVSLAPRAVWFYAPKSIAFRRDFAEVCGQAAGATSGSGFGQIWRSLVQTLASPHLVVRVGEGVSGGPGIYTCAAARLEIYDGYVVVMVQDTMAGLEVA